MIHQLLRVQEGFRGDSRSVGVPDSGAYAEPGESCDDYPRTVESLVRDRSFERLDGRHRQRWCTMSSTLPVQALFDGAVDFSRHQFSIAAVHREAIDSHHPSLDEAISSRGRSPGLLEEGDVIPNGLFGERKRWCGRRRGPSDVHVDGSRVFPESRGGSSVEDREEVRPLFLLVCHFLEVTGESAGSRASGFDD